MAVCGVIENAVEYKVFNCFGEHFVEHKYLPRNLLPPTQHVLEPECDPHHSPELVHKHSNTQMHMQMQMQQSVACRFCRQPISERFYLQVDNEAWHETCLQCSSCKAKLEHTCFVKNRQLFCRDDYYRLFLPKCADCKDTIMIGEYAMQALDCTYHLRCFNCAVCRQPLRKGDMFLLPTDTGKLICKNDYDRSARSPATPAADTYAATAPAYEHDPDHDSVDGYGYVRAHAGPSSVLDSESELATEGAPQRAGGAISSGGKRPRTILTMTQRRKFKQAFEINPKPSRKIRESLAADTGLTVRVVQVWFQNQRAKVKKLARRHALLSRPATGDSNANHKKSANQLASIGDEHAPAAANTSFDSLLDSTEHMDSSDEDSVASSNCLNNNSASTDTNAYQVDSCHVPPANGSKSSNPIDQLYSIQNKYFG